MRVILSTIVLVVGACVPSNGSKVKHEWSKVSRDGSNSMIQKCKYGELPTSAQLDEATKYFQKLGKHIADNVTKSFENDGMKSPFSGKFSFDNFCLEVIELGDKNAYAIPRFGNIYFDINFLKDAANDAQVAAVLTHEMSHILLAHESDHLSPNLRLSDLTSEQRLQELSNICYHGALNDIDNWSFDSVLGQSPEVEAANERYMTYFFKEQLLKKDQPFQTIADCEFAGSRRDELKKLFDLGDKSVTDKAEDTRKEWNETRELFYNSYKDSKITAAIEEAKSISDAIKAEFKDDPDAAYNWREQEADEVGMELLHRAGFSVKEAARFWMAELQRSEGTLVECGEKIGSGNVPPRGIKSHPNLCYRLNNIAIDEMKAHANQYRAKASKVKTVFEGELDKIKSN